MEIVKTHISNIRAGDTIIFRGKQTTVCKNNITYSSFMGVSIFGDTYNLGCKLVEKVIF